MPPQRKKKGAAPAKKAAPAGPVPSPYANERSAALVAALAGDQELAPVQCEDSPAAQDNSPTGAQNFRLLGSWPAAGPENRQTADFAYPVARLYTPDAFPPGEQILHGTSSRGKEEAQAAEAPKQSEYNNLRRAAEAHRQTRRYMQGIIKPGLTLMEIAQRLEQKSRELIGSHGVVAGWAFPTGVSLNHCAAHYTPNYTDDPIVLTKDDVMKVDFGVHVNGRLIDCAWTVAFDEKYDPLLESTKDATNTAIKAAGIDMRLGELGGIIEEVIRSYEIELGGKTIKVRPIANLSGHSIEPYRIHAGKSVPLVACGDQAKMGEGELFAIETFASTGTGMIHNQGPCSHYMLDYHWANTSGTRATVRSESALELVKKIQKNFGTLAFCRRWLEDIGCIRHAVSLAQLDQAGLVNSYPPLCDVEGCFTSQMEHTILLRPTCKEVLSRGMDY